MVGSRLDVRMFDLAGAKTQGTFLGTYGMVVFSKACWVLTITSHLLDEDSKLLDSLGNRRSWRVWTCTSAIPSGLERDTGTKTLWFVQMWLTLKDVL